jgi:CheY-like chemotaxis protein
VAEKAHCGGILVVDDDPDIRDSLREVLEDEGYDVSCVGNGQEALDHLKAASPRPCVILLDLMMPVMDGWQFLAERSRRSNATPVVLLSGLSFINDAPGVADFLCKPVNYEKLRDCLGRFCGSPGPAA